LDGANSAQDIQIETVKDRVLRQSGGGCERHIHPRQCRPQFGDGSQIEQFNIS